MAEFRARVLAAVRRIPPGRVATYGDVAALAGSPRAHRAVGNILRECRDPATPCHRVIGAGGALGGYGGNLQMKRALLQREGIEVGPARIRRFGEVRIAMKHRSRLLMLPLVLALGTCGGVTPPGDAQRSLEPGRIDANELMQVVRELSSPEYAGRGTGTEGGRKARAFVREAFAEIGLEPAGTSGYQQPFTVSGREGVNLIGAVAGTDPAAGTIVISAHYDHVGVRNGQIYAGADDNASGVAALLAIAREITARPLRHDVLFAAFDAEELDLAGAKAFVANPPVAIHGMALNVNLDMLSRSDRHEIYVAGTYHNPSLKGPLEDAAGRQSPIVLRFGHDRPEPAAGGVDDWTLQSDHGVFHEAGIPFVYFGVEDHADYHQPTDTADRIDPMFFRGVVELVLDSVIALDAHLAGAGVGPAATHKGDGRFLSEMRVSAFTRR